MTSQSVVPDVRFDEVNVGSGLRLHYAEQGPRDGEAVVCLHGFTDSWFSFSRVLPLFPEDWRVIVPDQRGHGESSRPIGGYSMKQFAQDALDLMDALGIERATVVGHCMGSIVGQYMAAMAPSRVSRLVLAGSCASTRQEPVLQLREIVDTLEDPVPLDFIVDFQTSTVHQAPPQDFLSTVFQESAKLPARVWKSVLADFLNAEPDHAAIRCPALLLWGDRDFFPFEEQEVLLRAIPNARLHVENGVGHSMQWEVPETFVREVSAFVALTSAARV